MHVIIEGDRRGVLFQKQKKEVLYMENILKHSQKTYFIFMSTRIWF